MNFLLNLSLFLVLLDELQGGGRSVEGGGGGGGRGVHGGLPHWHELVAARPVPNRREPQLLIPRE